MIGVPVLSVGDRAVLFLRRGPDGLWRPVGLAAGIYRVQSSAAGSPIVRAPVLLGATASAGVVRRGDAALAPMALTDFESLVRIATIGRGVVRRIDPVRRTR